mmetsp:Transcript_39678/g.60789  ORF Transcript_39678/g.60789 Transcript_39678/m.60789 type:complete len:89 (+) Transcript_39678:219-485(+)
MQNLEEIIGPQFCGLCDRNIGLSIKIRSFTHESFGSTNKPLVVCLECHRTGVTLSPPSRPTSKDEQARDSDSKPDTVDKFVVLDNLNY